MHPLTDSLWPGLLLWVVLYISDYTFTITCARMYRDGVREYIAFEGSFELTPYFQKDVDSLRKVSPRFLVALAATLITLVALWMLSRLVWPAGYAFGLGALVLVEAAIHTRHLRNYFLFRRILAGGAVKGRIEYNRPAMLELSAYELLGFAGVYLLLFIATLEPFIAGGVAGCLSLAAKHFPRARAPRPERSKGVEGQAQAQQAESR